MAAQLAAVYGAQLLAAESYPLQGNGCLPRAHCLSLITASDQLS